MFRISHFIYTFIYLISIFVFTELSFANNKVVVLRSQDLYAYNLAIDGFVNECKKNNILVKSIEDMAGRLDKGRKIIKKFIDNNDKPDLFLAVGVLAATLTKKIIKDIPVIFCMVVNYHRFDFDAPNINGIAAEIPESEAVKIFKDIIIDLKTVGVIYDPFKTRNIIENGKDSFRNSRIKLISTSVKSENEVDNALNKIIKEIDALWLVPDSTVISKRSFSKIYETTKKNKIPLLCTSDVFVKAGALVGVYPDYTNIGVMAGKMASTILKKGPPGSFYIKYPEQIEIAINLDTASRIGLDITEDIYKKHNVVEYP